MLLIVVLTETGRTGRASLMQMHALKAQVKGGQVVLTEPINLPDGTELYLVPTNGDAMLMADDGLTDVERTEVTKMIDESFEDDAAGRTVPFSEVLAKLRA
ncbi:MAG TPA: hypothetical protein VL137_11730 [Polyangiaceae bacterium]|nr:hypothetical protein [Polyangiaceae bacterium]